MARVSPMAASRTTDGNSTVISRPLAGISEIFIGATIPLG